MAMDQRKTVVQIAKGSEDKISLDNCYAKTYLSNDMSKLDYGKTVDCHCKIVGNIAKVLLHDFCTKRVANLFPKNSSLIVAVHDLGKISPTFQLKLAKAIDRISWKKSHPELVPYELIQESSFGGHPTVSYSALKNALIASSATFFALTANATDTTIDLTTSTPQTDIIVNAGDTVTLNNGKTAFPEDSPYTASKITVADGGTLKITNGGNFKVDELTVKSTNFLPTGEYYADSLPHFVDNNPDRTTISVKNAAFEGGTVYRPITIDNLVVTNNIDASNASLYGASGYKMRVTFEDNSTGNIRDLSVDELQLKKGTKVFIKNFSKMVGADGQFAVNSDFNSNISILAIKHDGDFFIGTYPDPGVDYENNSNGILGAVGANSALVFGVTSEAEAEQVLRDANLIITDTDGKTKLNESQFVFAI